MAIIEIVGNTSTPPSVRLNALEIVQEIQKRLRMPQSASLAAPHAILLLAFVNSVLVNGPSEGYVWDELKWVTPIPTVQGTPTYRIERSGYELDVLRNLQIGTSDPMTLLSDPLFREHRRLHTSQGPPKAWRHYSADTGTITIEVSPVPDAIYTIDVEALVKAKRLVLATDIPLIDPEILVLGGLTLAKEDQGEDATLAAAEYGGKLSVASGKSDSNWGDVDPW
jgi:hypothetical protein